MSLWVLYPGFYENNKIKLFFVIPELPGYIFQIWVLFSESFPAHSHTGQSENLIFFLYKFQVTQKGLYSVIAGPRLREDFNADNSPSVGEMGTINLLIM